MLTNGTQRLDDMLSHGKKCDDIRGKGFPERRPDKNKNKTVFVHASDKNEDHGNTATGE